MALTLLDGVAANGSGAWMMWHGGPSQVFVKGDLDGGNVTIQLSDDDGGTTMYAAKFVDGTDFTVASADAPAQFPVCGWAQGTWIRATLATGTAPTGVTVVAKQG